MAKIILAADEKWGIGKDGKLPWNLRSDLQFFQQVTKNSFCIMGYNTFREIADKFNYEDTGNFLPNRRCYVVTSRNMESTPSVKRVTSVLEAYTDALNRSPKRKIFFIGGVGIFKEAMEFVDTIYLTKVVGIHQCDVFFNPFEYMTGKIVEEKLLKEEKGVYKIYEYSLGENNEKA